MNNPIEKKQYQAPQMETVELFPAEMIGNLLDDRNADEPMLYKNSNGWGPWV